MGNWIGPVWLLGTIILIAVVVSSPNGSDQSAQVANSHAPAVAERQTGRDEAAALTVRDLPAGLAYSNLLFAKLLPCLILGASRQSTDAPAAKRPEDDVVTEWQSRLERQCVVYTQMEKAITPFVVALSNSRKAQDYFIFTVLEPADKFDSFSEKEVGIFPRLVDCQHYEKALHDLDVPTRKCQMRTIPSQRPSPPMGR